ncbi:MAG: hypothetical protein KDC49_02645 [Saprospiraceae bacterium]|nr:hypothetical protein [Saprospiraceae bacterium]
MNRIYQLFACFLCLINISCESEFTESTNHLQEAEVKVESGRIVFKNIETYVSVKNKLKMMTPQQIEYWSNSLGVETSYAAYYKFLKNSDELFTKYSETEIKDILFSKYASSLNIEYDEDAKLVILPKFEIFSPFTNEDGEFMIGDNLYKVFKDNFFILKPSHHKNAKNLRSYSVAEEGMLKFEFADNSNHRDLCSGNSGEYFEIVDDKKATISYTVLNYYDTYAWHEPNRYFFVHLVELIANASHEVRKGFIVRYWGCERTDYNFYAEIRASHNFPGSHNPPLFTLYGSSNVSDMCYTGIGSIYQPHSYVSAIPTYYQVNTDLVWLSFQNPHFGQVNYYCGN